METHNLICLVNLKRSLYPHYKKQMHLYFPLKAQYITQLFEELCFTHQTHFNDFTVEQG